MSQTIISRSTVSKTVDEFERLLAADPHADEPLTEVKIFTHGGEIVLTRSDWDDGLFTLSIVTDEEDESEGQG
jgi:hypothetical protein